MRLLYRLVDHRLSLSLQWLAYRLVDLMSLALAELWLAYRLVDHRPCRIHRRHVVRHAPFAFALVFALAFCCLPCLLREKLLGPKHRPCNLPFVFALAFACLALSTLADVVVGLSSAALLMTRSTNWRSWSWMCCWRFQCLSKPFC